VIKSTGAQYTGLKEKAKHALKGSIKKSIITISILLRFNFIGIKHRVDLHMGVCIINFSKTLC
jgi:hypothetical protein